MRSLTFALTLWVLLAAGGLLTSCGSNNTRETPTNTPTSTLGTDSAATKVGGTPPADTAGSGR